MKPMIALSFYMLFAQNSQFNQKTNQYLMKPVIYTFLKLMFNMQLNSIHSAHTYPTV